MHLIGRLDYKREIYPYNIGESEAVVSLCIRSVVDYFNKSAEGTVYAVHASKGSDPVIIYTILEAMLRSGLVDKVDDLYKRAHSFHEWYLANRAVIFSTKVDLIGSFVFNSDLVGEPPSLKEDLLDIASSCR